MPDGTGWSAVLDEFEGRLNEVRAGRLDPSAVWAPPVSLPRLPAELADRAGELLAAQQDAMSSLSAERDRVAAELVAMRRPSAPLLERAVYFDAAG